jgi:hypothetical protein
MKPYLAILAIVGLVSSGSWANDCYEHQHKVLDAQTNKFTDVTDSLSVSSANADSIEFSLSTVGPNFHQCQVKGKAVSKGSYFKYIDSLPGDVCRLRISFSDGRAHVLDPDYYPCHKYCGARGNIHLQNDGKTFLKTSKATACES